MRAFEPARRAGSMIARIRTLLAAALVAACQAPPLVDHVEQMRSFPKSKPVVWNEILAFLADHRIVPIRADPGGGRLLAVWHAFEDMGWAECERAWVVDHSSRSARPTRAQPVARDLTLWIGLREAVGTTEVGLEARFSEQQIDPYRNLPFTQPCRSRGVLEQALLDAL